MNLGDYIGTGSHSIPYSLTTEEIAIFLERHFNDVVVQQYLSTHAPAYGVIAKEGPIPSEFLVWFDASNVLHVIDVTFMPIAQSVQQAILIPNPTSVFIEEMLNQTSSFVQNILSPALSLGLVVALVVGFMFISREVRR
jgi:hypothetical protein